MENFNKNGEIKQPLCYNDFGIPSFSVEELYEDDIYVHVKGYVGYLEKDLKNINSTDNSISFQISSYDSAKFYIKYNKKNKQIEIDSGFRTTTCNEEEYEKFKNMFYYNKEIDDFNTGEHFPYFRLPRSKDCVLIPHFIQSLWNGNNIPKIFLQISEKK